MFGSFISKGTGLAVSVKSADPTVAQAQLENGTFDALITVGLYEHPSDTCVKLGTLPTGIVVTKSHPLAKKTIVTLSDLTAFPAGESSVFDNFNESVYRVTVNAVLSATFPTPRTLLPKTAGSWKSSTAISLPRFCLCMTKCPPRCIARFPLLLQSR